MLSIGSLYSHVVHVSIMVLFSLVGPVSRFLFLAWYLARSAWHNDEMKMRSRSLVADLDQGFRSYPGHVVVLSIVLI